jgi:MFS family permease
VLFYGLISDRTGRRPVILGSLGAFVLLTGLTGTAQSPSQMIAWRFVTGLGASGVVPLALAAVGELYPYGERGRPLGWLFGAMAGGMRSTGGVLLEPFVGWRALFLLVAALAAGLLVILVRSHPRSDTHGRTHRARRPSSLPPRCSPTIASLLQTGRGRRTYAYVLWNGTFHSGVYTWLGLYFERRFGLGKVGIGLALLCLAIGAGSAGLLAADVGLFAAAVAVAFLSLSYDMTQPLFAGIVTHLAGAQRGGQAMSLNVFMLFVGLGVGAALFGEALWFGLGPALVAFAGAQMAMTLAAIHSFGAETHLDPETVSRRLS